MNRALRARFEASLRSSWRGDGAWMERAACRTGYDPEMWFSVWKEADARRVCHGCVVRSACLVAAARFWVITDVRPSGVWGGKPEIWWTPQRARGVLHAAEKMAGAA